MQVLWTVRIAATIVKKYRTGINWQKDLFEEFFDEQVSPSRVQTPVLGGMTDVGAVDEQ